MCQMCRILCSAAMKILWYCAFSFHSANGSVERVEWHSLTQWSRRAQFHRRGQTDFSYRTWSAWTQITTKLVLHGLWALKSFSAVHMQRPVFSIHCRFAQAILILCFGAGFCVIALVCLRPCGPSEPRFKEVALVKTAGFVQKSCDCSRMVTFTLFSACCDPFFCHWKSVIWMIFHIRLHLSKEICWLICFFACLLGFLSCLFWQLLVWLKIFRFLGAPWLRPGADAVYHQT